MNIEETIKGDSSESPLCRLTKYKITAFVENDNTRNNMKNHSYLRVRIFI